MIACWKWGGCWSSGSGIRGLNDSLNVREGILEKDENNKGEKMPPQPMISISSSLA